MQFNISALMKRAAFPHAVSHLQLRETHISWVILTGEFAYKIKKSIDLGFIDALTLPRRRELCEQELRLNSRFAPDLYLAVVPIVAVDNELRVGAIGPAIEYAVKMRQFAAEQELPALLGRNDVTRDEILALARLLAQLHAEAPSVAQRERAHYLLRLQRTVEMMLSGLAANAGDAESAAAAQRLSAWLRQRMLQLAPVLQQRVDDARVRECHGDLHAGNIVRWNGRLVPFDCIEFNDSLRRIDVMNDVAFLFMDLLFHSRSDFAFAFLNRYLEDSGDYGGVRLLGLFAVYRALVRAMVAAIAAHQQPQRSDDYLHQVHTRLATARALAAPATPCLLLMHGMSGSGKSWLSERLVGALPVIRVRSDLERKRSARLDPAASGAAEFERDLYSPAQTRRNYARLLACAQDSLQGGIAVVIDAAFLDVAQRTAFVDLAARMAVPLRIIACHASASVLVERVQRRNAERSDVSDADIDVLRHQLKTFSPLTAAEQALAIQVDTSAGDALQQVVSAVQRAVMRPALTDR